MSPVPLGSSWGDRSSADIPVAPAARPRARGLVAALAGGALALLGLTVPWAAITPSGGTGHRYQALLTDLRPIAGPVAAALLILAGAGFALGRRRASPARWLTVTIAGAGAALALFLTVHSVAGSAVVGRDPATDSPHQIVAGHVVPSVGCVLYVLGLLLVATGAGLRRPEARPS